jgi:hypothetical protein
VGLEFIRGIRLDILVTAGYSSPRLQYLLGAADALHIPIAVLTNSWKDIYVRPRVPTHLWLLGLWTDDLRKDVLRWNPGLGPKNVVSIGSLHLASLRAVNTFPNRVDFCKQFGLDPGRPIVCYTAAAPSAVPGEAEIVSGILRELESHDATLGLQLLIRGNPMGGNERFQSLLDQKRAFLQPPDWTWLPESDWCAPNPGDLALWRATIEHSYANVSVASAVVLEFAMFGKPVINVLFGPEGRRGAPEGPRRYWESPFYAEVREKKWACAAQSPREVLDALTEKMALVGDVSQAIPVAVPEAIAKTLLAMLV